ncbi:Dothistromin biosynthesis peroxidase dotB-like protein 2 [Elsinoe fawcettii]|nr:Dothistromin biosynthesis peroxidase dotB-like protein 2 [Elsinoe fawcettii]
MKTTFSSLALLGLVAVSEAYPNILEHVAREAKAQESNSLLSRFKRQTVAFDADAQRIDVSGQHAFVPPNFDAGDQRGPCPGLNALANHNYLPHNGVGTITQFIEGTTKVFGMGVDLATFLSTYGAVVSGDGTKWSIGGPSGAVPGLLGLLGQPQGISGSHNKYETDVSPTRGDLYERGNDFALQLDQFQELYDLGKANDNYDIPLLTNFRATRFQQSIDHNPNFFYGPFSGVIVSPAAYTFIYRFMGNKSAEHPDGRLNGEILKSFFSVEGESGSFKHNPGGERIPEQWYTRNKLDPYSIPFLALDTNAMGLQHPQFLIPGGNTGTTGSYVGIDPENLSGGLFNAGNLAQGNNAACLAYQATVQFLPDILRGLFASITAPLSKLTSQFDSVTKALDCSQLKAIDKAQFNKYPGFTKTKRI